MTEGVLERHVPGGRLNDRGQLELPGETNGAGALVLPGFFGELSPTGYKAREGMTFEEWKSDGHKLHVVSEGSQWAIGDWWAYGRHGYGDRAKAAASGIFGRAFKTMANLGTTARRFETSRRREVVPVSFHAEVASLDPLTADKLLDLVESEKWTQKQLRAAVKAHGGRSPDDDEEAPAAHQLIQQSLTNEHYTPSIYVDAAREVLNGIDLDPASCAEANEVVRAKLFFSESQDGLSQDWAGSVWLNPPYGGWAGDFVAKLMVEMAAGRVTDAVVLVNSNCTDTKWFQPLWDGILCFTDHRINFYGGETERSGATHGSVFSYFGPRPVDFANIFRRFGAVVKRVQL
jgi:hypothetical protein